MTPYRRLEREDLSRHEGLQDFAIARGLSWARGIVVLDAAALLEATPEEGGASRLADPLDLPYKYTHTALPLRRAHMTVEKGGPPSRSDALAMFVARLENMEKNGDPWLTISEALVMLADCEYLEALTPTKATESTHES